jgi:hypothetical protein
MWCSRCQQDVPGIASDGQIRCARCAAALPANQAAEPVAGEAHAASAHGARPLAESPPFDLDNWQFDEDLRSAARVVRSLRVAGDIDDDAPPATSAASTATAPRQLDAAHANVPAWHASRRPRREPPPAPPRRPRRGAFFAWAMLSLGLMTFVCGGVLVGWSFFGGRAELWGLGLPLVLIGQAALIVGLVFQLDGLWQSNRETSRSLDDLDEQLDDLRQATTLLGSSHGSGARAFYSHLADGASPQMLLADLKGQMDLLAMRLAQERRSRSA